jgi:hypothetical protein
MDMAEGPRRLLRFSKGSSYRFRVKPGRQGYTTKGRGHGPIAGLPPLTYSFMDRVPGRGVDLFLFMSAAGKWRESFTVWRLGDYEIEGAA